MKKRFIVVPLLLVCCLFIILDVTNISSREIEERSNVEIKLFKQWEENGGMDVEPYYEDNEIIGYVASGHLYNGLDETCFCRISGLSLGSSYGELEIEKHLLNETIELFADKTMNISRRENGDLISYLAVANNEVFIIDISIYDNIQEVSLRNLDNYVKSIFE
jgi:hypothetical protein